MSDLGGCYHSNKTVDELDLSKLCGMMISMVKGMIGHPNDRGIGIPKAKKIGDTSHESEIRSWLVSYRVYAQLEQLLFKMRVPIVFYLVICTPIHTTCDH